MPVDFDRYNALVARAAFRFEPFRGTIQDLSSAQRAMQFSGSPTWPRLCSLAALKQSAPNDRVQTVAAYPAIVDVTGAFSVECLMMGQIPGTDFMVRQYGVGTVGGFWCGWEGTLGRWRIDLFDAAGVSARRLVSANGTTPAMRPFHVVASSIAGGTAGLFWIAGKSVTVGLTLVGVASNVLAPAVIAAGGSNVGIACSSIIRVWTGAMGNDDAAALYGVAQLMTGGEV